jgi:GNAT superfamily N-acetyltransferase
MARRTSIRIARSPEDFEAARKLILEYAASLNVDLAFQDFAGELATLATGYNAPGGVLFLASTTEDPVGCVGVRPYDPPEVAELKRLYVRPRGRGEGLGRELTVRALDWAKRAGYRRVRLDTLPGMDRAQELYRRLGFSEIPPYRHNPVPGTVFMEYELPG